MDRIQVKYVPDYVTTLSIMTQFLHNQLMTFQSRDCMVSLESLPNI